MPEVRPLSPEGAVDVTRLYVDLLGGDAHGDRPHVALNMVTSADGRATLAGTADIGSRTDRALLRHLRSLADAVLIGAGTLRANDFTPRVSSREAMDRRELAARPPQPIGVVVSRLGDLPTDRKFFSLAQERVVAVSERAPEAARSALRGAGATVVAFGRDDVDLATLLRWLLRERGVRVLLCEGGPHLVGRLLAMRLIDEVFLTQAWRVTAEPGALSWVESDAALDVRLEPVESYEGDGERYGRFRVAYSR
ncbi:MAG TPA: dihydrofolate reductase family protein [Candidatus Dormibacteraeota bacterium]|nr:dihydrofolate reductase family protein [Candidatus Dormibacteraeota bacterium]